MVMVMEEAGMVAEKAKEECMDEVSVEDAGCCLGHGRGRNTQPR
jgi:hypothetical protein